MSVLLRYFMIVVACVFLLVGMQLPNLTDQYTKRVDAQLREASGNLQPFLQIASQYTQGSIEALIALHRKNTEAVYRAEADAIERLYRRKQHLTAELQALQTHLPGRLWHIAMDADPEIREQTILQYTATVPLTEESLGAGAVTALAVLLLLEFGMGFGRFLHQTIKRWINHRWHGV